MSSIRRIGIVRILTAVMLVALARVGGPTLAAPSQQAEQTVRMVDDAFEPKTLTIPVGTRVTWPNTGQRPHTSSSDTNVWDSGNVNPGGSFSFTFTQTGTFPYHCKYHGSPGGQGMAGTIVVTAAQGEPGPTPAPATPTPTTAAAAPAAPEGPPAVRFTAPANGASVGSTVTLQWTSSGVTIVPGAQATERTQAHYHVFVDTEPNLQEGQPIRLGDPRIVHTAATSLELRDLAAGQHTATIVLGYSDHTPWVPFVMDTVTFTVAEAAPAPAPAPAPGPPAALPDTGADNWQLPIVVLAAALLLLAAGTMLRRARARR